MLLLVATCILPSGFQSSCEANSNTNETRTNTKTERWAILYYVLLPVCVNFQCDWNRVVFSLLELLLIYRELFNVSWSSREFAEWGFYKLQESRTRRVFIDCGLHNTWISGFFLVVSGFSCCRVDRWRGSCDVAIAESIFSSGKNPGLHWACSDVWGLPTTLAFCSTTWKEMAFLL